MELEAWQQPVERGGIHEAGMYPIQHRNPAAPGQDGLVAQAPATDVRSRQGQGTARTGPAIPGQGRDAGGAQVQAVEAVGVAGQTATGPEQVGGIDPEPMSQAPAQRGGLAAGLTGGMWVAVNPMHPYLVDSAGHGFQTARPVCPRLSENSHACRQ